MKHSKEIGAGCRPGLWSRMKKKKSCYLFLLPFFLLFTVFTVIPVVVAIGLSFTQYNVLEATTTGITVNTVNSRKKGSRKR